MNQGSSQLNSFNHLHLTGPFGFGKTTLALQRIQWLLQQERVRGNEILILVPQRTLAQPYYEALRGPDAPPGPPPRVTTVSALARSAIELYWPLVAERADFDDPSKEPTFLNLETSQYHMATFVDIAIGQAEFDGIRIERSRVISQVLDNMNKAALQGLSIEEVYQRLTLAIPSGEQRVARLNALNAAQRISQQFRQLCLQETLIDFSLQTTLFNEQVLTNEWSRVHLFRSYRHLIVDNAEEDNTTSHRLLQQWIPQLESTLIISDSDAGYRLFLGADPVGVTELAASCAGLQTVTQSYVTSPQLTQISIRMEEVITGRRQNVDTDSFPNPFDQELVPPPDPAEIWEDPFPPEAPAELEIPAQLDTEPTPAVDQPYRDEGEDAEAAHAPDHEVSHAENLRSTDSAVERLPDEQESPGPEDADGEALLQQSLHESIHIPNKSFRFYPQMIDWVVEEVRRLIQDDGVPPEQIVLLAPFVSDALRFSIQNGLERHEIALATHRPSRALQNEPAARALITLAKLAHPDWGLLPAANDVTITLTVAISQMDPVRASLLSQIVYPPRSRNPELGRFGGLVPAMQQRVSFVVGERYDELRDWIMEYRANAELLPLDQFFARLFGEILSQEGYGFHNDHDAARIANQLVESSKNFRWSLQSHDGHQTMQKMGLEYIQLLESGALGALFAPGWQEATDAVFLAPAYTFMMRNRAADIQFWLDIGSGGWWERLYQPLTHPHVLSHRWPSTQIWTDHDEEKTRQDTLRRLLLGLLRRTRQRVYLGLSDYSESGFEQRGPLLGVINRLLAQQEGR